MDVSLSLIAQKHQRIHDSMIVPNFQDRFKTIIASALKDSSRVEDSGGSPEKVKEKIICNGSSLILSPSHNGFPEVFSKEQEKSSENQDEASLKYDRNIQDQNEQLGYMCVPSKEYKTNGNSFKQVELSDPEVSSSLTNAAYSPISPSRTPPPSSGSPVFHIHDPPVKSALNGYTINLGLSVSRNMLSHEYHTKRINHENITECSKLGMYENKNDSMNSLLKDSMKPLSISSFSHLLEQSKLKAVEEMKGKNGYALNSRSHSHQSSSGMFREDEYRKLKSKYHSPLDMMKDRRMKHRPNSFHVSKTGGKKDISYSKSSRSGSKFESKRSHSKHSYSSSKCKCLFFNLFKE